jgi:LETM1-like protein
VKLIFSRRKEIALIRARVKAGGTPLTRSEHRLIRTQKDDVIKCVFFTLLHFHHSFSIYRIIPFVFIALILEEAIPVIAICAPFMLPSTCILPSQQQRIEEQRAEKAKTFAIQYKYLYGHLKETESPKGFLPLQSLRLQEASTAVCGYVSSILVERGLK